VLWSFGDGATSTELSPGAHTYADAGTFAVTFTATDSKDLSDPTPATRTITVAVNQPPEGTIVSPAGDITIAPGDAVTFEGAASDPDGDEVHVLWSFGDGATSTELSPGAHTYADAGTFAVTFTATDSKDLSDPTPATRTITVAAANQPPDGAIVVPPGNAATREGGSVTFEGAASDPDGDEVTVVWDFGDGATSTALSPGNHVYVVAGEYTVTFTATDSHSLADPSPATITVTVGVNAPPDGTIVTPAADATAAVGQSVAFQGAVTDPDDATFSVQWDFGDGVSSGALATAHAYLTPGTYTVTFTATDALGKVDPTPATRGVTVIQAVTLTELQNEVFSDTCSGCHPPNGGGLDLRAGRTFASIVDVNSSQQPSLKRVKPGDPNNSYLIRKLNGGPGISGSRMPQGGPFLAPSQLQRIRDWILAGAANN
jgi:PKD repeat protein